MASVFKREGAGKSNRWYAQIKVGSKWKVVRLPAVYSGEGAIKKDKALYLALETESLANKALGIEVNESVRSLIFMPHLTIGMVRASCSHYG